MAFGDVNLSDEQVRESFGVPQNPGAGGWPTIRYFNQETGYGGAPYEQTTSGAMCDELGNVDTMRAYVEDFGVKICEVATGGQHCTEKQMAFAEKWKEKSPEDVLKQIKRLEGMKAGKMKPDLLEWLKQRLVILKQYPFAANDKVEEAKEKELDEAKEL